jgi:hypothetical protein
MRSMNKIEMTCHSIHPSLKSNDIPSYKCKDEFGEVSIYGKIKSIESTP